MGNDFFVLKDSGIHGKGAFARAQIRARTDIVEYLGEKISKAESLARCEANNAFIFTLDDKFDLDGDVDWNPARFFNHSCGPNCDAESREGHIWIVARRDIAAGEELTFNYGYDLESYNEYPCSCGSAECAGYMVAEEYFDHVRKSKARMEQSS